MRDAIKHSIGTIKPNLSNYEDTYNSFSWESFKKEIGFKSGDKLNAANIGEFIDYFKRKDGLQKAFTWIGEDDNVVEYTFDEYNSLSNKFANLLVKSGLKKGERVFFFLPRIPLAYYGFVGALKMGAVGGNLFAAFAPDALKERLLNAGAKILVTNRELLPRFKEIEKDLPEVKVIIAEDFESQIKEESDEFKTVPMDESDPAFMLYTSSTGNTPVCGIVIPHGAIFQQLMTAQWVLDLHGSDMYWCTADPGWVTGTVYGILSPWNLGISQIVHEGRFSAEKWFSILEKFEVSVWYTAPTALRMLQQEENIADQFQYKELRHICSVGEALPPATIDWSLKVFKLPVHDTWWQTETGAMMITNNPAVDIMPGSMGKPVPGVTPAILGEDFNELPDGNEGSLAFKVGWPSMMVDVWKNRKQYERYFEGDWYITGDRAIKDKDGYYTFVGRADDVIKTAGERVGPFEVESCLMECEEVAEAGVIGKPDPLRGQVIKAFVVLKVGQEPSDELTGKLQQYVKSHLAGHAYPREIEYIDKLPKNRSGKIVRRILKSKELGLPIGDVSTLE